jgi:hypothetical protein
MTSLKQISFMMTMMLLLVPVPAFADDQAARPSGFGSGSNQQSATEQQVSGSQTVGDKMIYLQCGQGGITVDLTNNLVISSDKLPATISATDIYWQRVTSQPHDPSRYNSGTDIITQYFHIDRTSGIFTFYMTVKFPGGMNTGATQSVTCAVSAPPPTKF